jgi:hypothetical protein
MPLKTLGPIGPRAVGERVKKSQFLTMSKTILPRAIHGITIEIGS